MKHLKREDGYVLPYVLIVFAVVSLVAVSVCSVAINNLRVQEAAVRRAQALYEAEGKVERFTAIAKASSGDEYRPTEQDALDDFAAELRLADTDSVLKDIEITGSEAVLTLQAGSSAQIDAVVKLQLDVDVKVEVIKDKDAEENVIETVETYKVTDVPDLTYESYAISYHTAAAPEGGGAS